MMEFQRIIKQAILLACAVLLAACSGQQVVVPTQDISQTLVAARTEAAGSVMTQIASQASPTPLPATSTLAPSSTPLPSDTAAPLNTAVPQMTATKTLIPTIAAPLYSFTPRPYNCSILKVTPAGDEMPQGIDFDARWTVKNTGSATWNTQDYDYKYISGEKMHTKGDYYNLQSNVDPGSTFDIVVDMQAPNTKGPYTATWALVTGNTTVCTLTVNIRAK